MRSRPTSRRALLMGIGALGATVVMSSCSTETPAPVALASDPEAPTDIQADSELQLIALYSAITQAFPDLAGRLTPIADQHREHARVLGPGVDPPRGEIQVPPSSRQALRLLVDAERQASLERQDGCAIESDPERVRLLALIAASEASHVPELTSLEGTFT